MNKSIIIIFLFSVLISCSKSEDSLINPDGITDHEITSHSNNRVSSLLMTKSEYRDWVNNDEFRNSERRKSLTNDLYKKYADFAKTFFIENPHPWENILIEKNYAYINAHSHLFNKILIWPCFDKFDNKFIFNQNVKIIEKPLVEMGGDHLQTNNLDTRINHLKPVKHKKVYNRLVEWIEDV